MHSWSEGKYKWRPAEDEQDGEALFLCWRCCPALLYLHLNSNYICIFAVDFRLYLYFYLSSNCICVCANINATSWWEAVFSLLVRAVVLDENLIASNLYLCKLFILQNRNCWTANLVWIKVHFIMLPNYLELKIGFFLTFVMEIDLVGQWMPCPLSDKYGKYDKCAILMIDMTQSPARFANMAGPIIWWIWQIGLILICIGRMVQYWQYSGFLEMRCYSCCPM